MSEERHYNPVDNPVEYELQGLVYVALGEASMQWDPIPKGVFDSKGADKIGKKLIQDIMNLIRKV